MGVTFGKNNSSYSFHSFEMHDEVERKERNENELQTERKMSLRQTERKDRQTEEIERLSWPPIDLFSQATPQDLEWPFSNYPFTGHDG